MDSIGKDDFLYQPDFYRFSEHSVQLVRWAISKIDQKVFKKEIKILELCAGCGYIGIEFVLGIQSNRHILRIDFCELQKDFIDFLNLNVKKFLSPLEIETQIHHCSLKDLHLTLDDYNYVFINPPFFIRGKSLVPSINQKEVCHFWNEQDVVDLVDFINGMRSNKKVNIFIAVTDKPNTIFKMLELRLKMFNWNIEKGENIGFQFWQVSPE